MQVTNLTPKQLRQAADLQERIQSLQKQLNGLLSFTEAAPAPVAAKKRTLSRAGRAAIAAAARERWAKRRGEAKVASPSKPKRVISAAGRARLAAAARERWKKAKASGKSTL